MNLKNTYLALAIAGAVVPFVFFAQHFQSTGFGLSNFVGSLFANPAASGFTADLLITSLVFWITIIHRRNHENGPKPALYIVLNLLIGLSCALPAYLYASLARDEADLATT